MASFDAVPCLIDAADIAVFNASLHYATDLRAVLAEARRVTRAGGAIAILDSPFYPARGRRRGRWSPSSAQAGGRFGGGAAVLASLPSIEFLTPAASYGSLGSGLISAASSPGTLSARLQLRPLLAALRGAAGVAVRLWTAEVR